MRADETEASSPPPLAETDAGEASSRPHRRTVAALATELRERAFVGREAELAFLESLLFGAPPLFAYLQAPGGFGKTALLRRFEQRVREHDLAAERVDLAAVPAEAGAAREALSEALRRLEAAGTEPAVLILDGFEAHAGLEAVYRERLFPRLPATVRTVFAGRLQLSDAWRADPAWDRLLAVRALRRLPPEASRALLSGRGVAGDAAEDLLRLADGHPGALVALARDPDRRSPEAAREVVLAGLDLPVERPRYEGLLALAIAEALDGPMLEAILSDGDAGAVARWLSRRPYVTKGAKALRIDPAHRAPVLDALRAQLPHAFRDLFLRALDHLAERLEAEPDGERRQRWVLAMLRVLSGLPPARPQFAPVTADEAAANAGIEIGSLPGGLRADRRRPSDDARLDAAVRRHEGPEAAAIAAAQRARRPEWLCVLRDGDGRPLGFVQWLVLERTDEEDARLDPAIAVLKDHLPEGCRALVFRTWMGLEHHQSASLGAAAATSWLAATGLSRRPLDFHLVVSTGWDLGDAWVERGALARFERLDFEAGGRRYTVRGLDLRRHDAVARLRACARQLLAEVAPPLEVVDAPSKPAAVDAATLERAVRDALRWFGDEARLARNPLVGLSTPDGPIRDADEIRALLRSEAAELSANHRSPPPAVLLDRTYFEPIGKQLAVADDLGLAYGTYRRRLRAAIRALVARVQARLAPPSGRPARG